MRNNWFVITGGPSSGKSTTIQLLKEQGYKTTTETARRYIESELKKGLTMDDIRANQLKFQSTIFKLQNELEDSLSPTELTFLDRAAPDTLAYLIFRKCSVPDEIYKKCQKNISRYKKVFLLEQLSWEEDNVRIENHIEAQEISDQLWKAYTDLGAEVIKVPVMEKEKRTEFILSKLS